MLAVIGAENARLHAGSLALCLTRIWGVKGLHTVLVDADTTGAALANRFGEATRATFMPSERGTPSMIASREPLSTRLLAEHCYNLSVGGSKGSAWAAFAPVNVGGGALAARWLSERVGALREIDAERAVVVSGSLALPTEVAYPILQAASILVMLAPASTAEELDAVNAQTHKLGLDGNSEQVRLLIGVGHSVLPGADILSTTGMHLLGRLPIIEDDKFLRMQGGRRERPFFKELKGISDRLLRVFAAVSEGALVADERSAAVEGAVATEEPVQAAEVVQTTDEPPAAADAVTVATDESTRAATDEPSSAVAVICSAGSVDGDSVLEATGQLGQVVFLPESASRAHVGGVLVLPSVDAAKSPGGVVALRCEVKPLDAGRLMVIPIDPIPADFADRFNGVSRLSLLARGTKTK